jgi:hypothetical protein
MDLDAEVKAIVQREAGERKAREAARKAREAADDPHAMQKIIQAAFAKAERAHRIANETVEVKTIEC